MLFFFEIGGFTGILNKLISLKITSDLKNRYFTFSLLIDELLLTNY